MSKQSRWVSPPPPTTSALEPYCTLYCIGSSSYKLNQTFSNVLLWAYQLAKLHQSIYHPKKLGCCVKYFIHRKLFHCWHRCSIRFSIILLNHEGLRRKRHLDGQICCSNTCMELSTCASCQFQLLLRAWKSQASNTDFQPCPVHTEISLYL